MFWGYSSAVDLQEELKDSEILKDEDEINVLIIGAADARHILKTISKSYTCKNPKKINFYVAEILLELIARQLLLLLTAFEPPEALGLKEKVRLWMDIYGNTLVRPNTASYISQKACQLIHGVTDFSFLKSRLPAINLDMLKYKERDDLETIFKFWSEEKTFNITQHWNSRLRKTLGVRYDARHGIYDWDYQIKLKDRKGGERINNREYRQWRDSGVAFTWLETDVSETNLTLTNGIFRYKDKILHHGYLGDMENGPYLAFGLNSEDKEMLKTRNGIYVKRSTDITERNLLRMFWEIEHQSPYNHPKEEDEQNLGVVITELKEFNVTEKEPEASTSNQLDNTLTTETFKNCYRKKEEYSSIQLPDFRIIFFPPTTLAAFPHHHKYQNFFHLIWISQNLMKKLSPDIVAMAKDEGVVLIENRNFVISLSKEDYNKTAQDIDLQVTPCCCKIARDFNYKTDSHAKYFVQRSSKEDQAGKTQTINDTKERKNSNDNVEQETHFENSKLNHFNTNKEVEERNENKETENTKKNSRQDLLSETVDVEDSKR